MPYSKSKKKKKQTNKPRCFGEVADSETGAENIQDDLRASCSAKKEENWIKHTHTEERNYVKEPADRALMCKAGQLK